MEESYCSAQPLDCIVTVGEVSSSGVGQFTLFEIAEAAFYWTLWALTTISYSL